MKSVLPAVLLIGLLAIITPETSLAHGDEGQLPFLTINGDFARHYPITSTSLPDFVLPHDQAPDNYLVNQPIDFKVFLTNLRLLTPLTENPKFIWYFGDGSQETGREITYAYNQPGSYFLSLYLQFEDERSDHLLHTVLIHILPDKNYQLPQANIRINHVPVYDAHIPFIYSFTRPITLDASYSDGSTPIVSYFWDLGDRQSSNSPVISHQYETYHFAAAPVLRVRDANGFIADATIQIEDADDHDAVHLTTILRQLPPVIQIVSYTTFILLAGIAVRSLYKRRQRLGRKN